MGSLEPKQLYKMRGSMSINTEKILEVLFVENQREKWRVVCPEISKNMVIWTYAPSSTLWYESHN